MWSVEFVKKTDTGQRATPIAKAIEGHRYMRQRRMAKTSRPTIASASRIESEEEKARSEGPVDELSSRFHAQSGGRR